MSPTYLVGLTNEEIEAVLSVLTKNWVEPSIQPLIVSASMKLARAKEMKSGPQKV